MRLGGSAGQVLRAGPSAHGRHRRRVRELFVEQSPLRLSEIGQMVSEATATYKVSVAEVRLAVGFDDDRS